MTEDYTQEMKFWFGNRYGDESDMGQVHLERGADYLPNVMEAFERFLRQAGFTYIELLTDGESWQFIKTGGLSEFEPDIFEDADWDSEERRQDVRDLYEGIYADEEDELAAYEDGIEDQGDEWTEDDWDFYASDELFDEYFAQLDAEREAYEAERTYDEAYYDPFTRQVDWGGFFR